MELDSLDNKIIEEEEEEENKHLLKKEKRGERYLKKRNKM